MVEVPPFGPRQGGFFLPGIIPDDFLVREVVGFLFSGLGYVCDCGGRGSTSLSYFALCEVPWSEGPLDPLRFMVC